MTQRIVTIDGPAGSGKGTVGQQLAVRLGWRFLDSGALYRACAYLAVQHQLDPEEPQALIKWLEHFEFESIPSDSNQEAQVWLNGEEISVAIRTADCGQMASKLAVNPAIRHALLAIQREYYRPPGLIADGRDMGSVIFPDAVLKVYLTASLEVRAKRKLKQLKEKDISLKYDNIYREIEKRDLRDSTRSHAPLATPEGALVVDTSLLDVEQVTKVVLEGIYSIRDTNEPVAH